MKKLLFLLALFAVLALFTPKGVQAVQECQPDQEWTKTDVSCRLTCQAPYNESTSRESRVVKVWVDPADGVYVIRDCKLNRDPSDPSDCPSGWSCEKNETAGASCVKKVIEYKCTCCRIIPAVKEGPPGAIDFDRLFAAFPGFKFADKKIGDIVNALIPSLFVLAGLLLLLYLIWGGYTYMLSRGDEKATALAKERITNAVVGFVIIFVAFWLVRIIGLLLGIEQFKTIF